MPVTKSCEQCGREYRIPPSRAKTSRFCCMACASAAKVIPIRKPTYKPKPGGLECEICGKHYWALGVHVKHKHGISAKDYKAEYGHLLSRPLVHSEISEALRDSAKRRLVDQDYKRELVDLCKKNAEAGKSKPGRDSLSDAGRELLRLRNTARNEEYLQSIAARVQASLDKTGFLSRTARELGMAFSTVSGMAKRGLVTVPKGRNRLVGAT